MARTVAAGIILVNKNNEILICHPTNHNWETWSIPKGRLDEGEGFLDAAIRETYEETNIDLSKAIIFQELEPQKYVHGKKIIHPFFILESKNPMIDFNSFDLKCNSNVPEEQGGFPEMDAYEWTDFTNAKKLVHYTQSAAIEEMERILSL